MNRLSEHEREAIASETLRIFEDTLKESESLGEEVIMGKQQVLINTISI